MDINDIRKIGKRLREEIPLKLKEHDKAASLGRGAGGDMTHPVDKLAEDIVYEELVRLGEPVTLISEECGIKDIKGGGPRLLVDPIDGSRNAVSGIPLFSTAIALIDGDSVAETSIGYVINLVSGDEFWALKGAGSFHNGNPITAQKDDVLRAVVYESSAPGVEIPKIMPLISLFNRARCFGSTALDMAFLAQGAVSVFVVPSSSRPFDFVAGCLLIKEAGGIVTDVMGGAIDDVTISVDRTTSILASANRELHEKALAVLKS